VVRRVANCYIRLLYFTLLLHYVAAGLLNCSNDFALLNTSQCWRKFEPCDHLEAYHVYVHDGTRNELLASVS